MVTSVERGRAVDVSCDEGRLLFPHGVVPHPPDTTLYTEGKKAREKGEEGRTQRRSKNVGEGTSRGRKRGDDKKGEEIR